MGGKSGGGGGRSTTTNTPWAAQQPFLIRGFQVANDRLNRGPERFFPGSTFAGQSNTTGMGLDALQQRATQGSDVTGNAQNFINQQLSGNPQFSGGADYLNMAPDLSQSNQQFGGIATGVDPQARQTLEQAASGGLIGNNPYLDSTYDRAAEKLTDNFTDVISPQIAGQFSSAGRTGSDAALRAQIDAAEVTGDSLVDLNNAIYGGDYQQERNRQLNAASSLGGLDQQSQGVQLNAAGQGAQFFNQQQQNALQAGGLDLNAFGQQLNQQNNALGLANPIANQDYRDINELLRAGGIEEGYTQGNIDAARERFDFNQQAPRRAIADYIAAIQGNYGGTSQTNQRAASGGRLRGAAGGALAGSAFGPPGILIGGALGALSG